MAPQLGDFSQKHVKIVTLGVSIATPPKQFVKKYAGNINYATRWSLRGFSSNRIKYWDLIHELLLA